jgi:hypothetical protein
MEWVGNQLNSDRTATFLTKKMHFSNFSAGQKRLPFNQARRWSEGRRFGCKRRSASQPARVAGWPRNQNYLRGTGGLVCQRQEKTALKRDET